VVAVASAITGRVVLIPYLGLARAIGAPTHWYDLLIHAPGDAAILVLLRVPMLSSWVDGHVMADRGRTCRVW